MRDRDRIRDGHFQLSTNWLLKFVTWQPSSVGCSLLVHDVLYAMILNFFRRSGYASILGPFISVIAVSSSHNGFHDQITTLLVTGGAVVALAAAVRKNRCFHPRAARVGRHIHGELGFSEPRIQHRRRRCIRRTRAVPDCWRTTAFIADIVVSGIKSVPVGQIEAAYSLGLRRLPALRLVVILKRKGRRSASFTSIRPVRTLPSGWR